ncbi:MAG: flagellar biosynthesis protein FlhB [Planctomycetota bacterium]|jgi:flagellar biosynthetic protein FlhB
MPEKPAAERTEQPTPKKLERARKKGQVPQSQELTSMVTLLALILILALLAPTFLKWSITQVRGGMSCETAAFADSLSFWKFAKARIVDSMLIICPILAALFAGSILACAAISGLNFTPEAVTLKFNQLNPVEGFAKLINARSMVKLLVSIFKLLFVTLIVWFYLKSRLDMLAKLRWAWSAQMLVATAKIILGLLIRVGIALLVIGIADALYQKWKYIQDLKMTRQEVKRERKDIDGSPEVKSRMRRLQIEMSRSRMLQEVPLASVVLVNPTHFAVALRYDAKTTDAPIMVAKGADQMAEKIREIARAYGVPIIRRPELTRTIYSTVKLGQLIPQTLYVAVAEVLAMIHRLRNKNK